MVYLLSKQQIKIDILVRISDTTSPHCHTTYLHPSHEPGYPCLNYTTTTAPRHPTDHIPSHLSDLTVK